MKIYDIYIKFINILKKVILLFLIFFQINKVYADVKIPVEVVKFKDGDTIEVRIEKNTFSVRLIGIDCYETSKINRAYKQAYLNKITIEDVVKNGNLSKLFLESIYKKEEKVFLDFRGIDKYGRALGIIYFDKLNVNEILKTQGGCFVYEF